MAELPEILFYQITRSRLEKVLADLLQKSLDKGWRAVVQAADGERVDALDQALWTYDDQSFLPHGRLADPHDEDQPILLTDTAANPNNANVRVMVDGAVPETMDGLERAIFLIDGRSEDAIGDAQRACGAYVEGGHAVTYWREGEGGGWQKVER